MGKLDHYIEKLKQPIVEYETPDGAWIDDEDPELDADIEKEYAKKVISPEAWKNFLYNATYDKLNDILEALFDEAMRDRVKLKMGEKREAAKKVMKKAINELITGL